MKLHSASRALLLSMLIATFVVAGCSPEADSGAESVTQEDILGAAALPDTAVAPKPVAATRSALVPCTPDVDSTLVINEIMADPVANPGGTDTYGEWIEIHNPGAVAIDLFGYSLADQGTNLHTIGANVVVPPGGYVVLCRSNDPLLNGGVACNYMYLNTILSNSNDAVILRDQANDVVDQVVYTGTAVPAGRSMALRNPNKDNSVIAIPADPNDPGAWAALNWGASTAIFGDGDRGTPGAKNADVWKDHSDVECNDSQLCTMDTCVNGFCENTWIENCCTGADHCNDNDICTQDLCDTIQNTCKNLEIANCCKTTADCLDDNPCNADYCMGNRCRHSAYNIVPGCCYAPPDAHPFNGQVWVDEQERQLFADSQCDDGNACSTSQCNQDTNLCYVGGVVDGCCNVNEDCFDDNSCTYDICFNHICSNPKKSASCCVTNADCNDNDPCTRDVCYIGNCRFYFSATECCNPADPTFCERNADDGNPCTTEICVQNPATSRYECQHQMNFACTMPLPFIETFDEADSFSGIGWTPINLPGSTAATNHWLLATSAGDLGLDKHVLFDWYPTAQLVKTALVSPTIDASTSENYQPNQFTKKTTLQWRMAYKHSHLGTPITLRVVGSTTNDFVNGFVLWATTTSSDIDYDLMSVELPAELKYAPNLRLGFVVDTGTASTVAMENWEIDDVKLGAGVANDLVKSMVYSCPGDAVDCRPGVQATLVGVGGANDPVPDIQMGVCGWTRIYLCYDDADGSQAMTWNYFGFPGAYLDGAPLDNPDFIGQTPTVGLGLGCETNSTFVRGICGADSTANIYCAIDVKPECDDQWAGAYTAGLICKDEGDPGKAAQSPFESLVKVNVELILEDGYIVWSPNGVTDASAVAMRDQIHANGRRVQIIEDLSRISDLTRYDGVFAALGVFGRYYTVTPIEAGRLATYLDAGGRVFLEGGEFFFTEAGNQPQTVLHDYFKATATYDGVGHQDGPMKGANLLFEYNYDLSQNAQFNAWNDRLVHTLGQGGRQILRNDGVSSFASVVSYDAIALGGTYRSIGSSFPFGGLVAQSGGRTVRELMGKYLDFLENGYPSCTVPEQCEDYDVCTDDACSAGACVNEQRPGCTPCLNDKFAIDGTSLSCGLDEACDVSVGYCVPIEGQRFDVNLGSCDKLFGVTPTQASCIVNVPQPGLVEDVQVKVKVNHYYRGDVELALTSPSGATVALKDANLADGKSHVYATYDVGVPEAGNLDDFNGTNLAGAWNLVATDHDPLIYNGLFEEWHLFATYGLLSCTTGDDCPVNDLCATYECVGDQCVPNPTDCDDADECTIDSCNPVDGSCTHTVIPGCAGVCDSHADCAVNEACLACDPIDVTCTLQLERTCNPATDIDPIEGITTCRCAPIPGVPYPLTTGLPVAIPDEDLSGVVRTINVTAPGYVRSVKAKIKTTHTSQGDLTAVLCHESVCVTLRYLQGGQAAGFFDIYNYDAESGPGLLTEFAQMPIAGNWTLTVADRLPGDEGSLTAFTLYVDGADCYSSAQCDDGNQCTVDTCQNPSTGGTCEHTQVTCQASDDTCLSNQCNPTSGVCEPVYQANGTSCDNGLYCTEESECQAGVCTAVTPRSCEFLDDICQVGTCNENLRQCIAVVADDGTPCDDRQNCTLDDFCEAGTCMPGPTLVCQCPAGTNAECAAFEDGDKCNGSDWICNAAKFCELADGPVICPPSGAECVSNVCDSFDGVCKLRDALNNMPCEDGLFCTVTDYCLSGECQSGEPRSCADMDTECRTGVCDESAGQCMPNAKPEGTTCEADGAGCTIDECRMGSCTYLTNVNCSLVSDDCNDGVCQNVGWGSHVCVKGPLADGTECTDEPDPCTVDTCQAGWCQHERVDNCNGPCGGDHAFDAGDDMCGFEDSCENGYLGYPNGACVGTCTDANCVRVASAPELGLPIDDKLACTMAALDVATTFQYVQSIDAKVKLDHSYLADLTLSVIDPQGYEHRIWDHIGGNKANFNNTFDLSMPVPYPFLDPAQQRVAGVPMCSLAGEQAAGTWWLKVCDTGVNNGGVLRNWKLYVRGSNTPGLNPGHRCETAIDRGNQDVNPAITVTGTTECAINSIAEPGGCGGMYGPDRVYKFDLNVAKRVTIRLQQDARDLVLFLKESAGSTCAPGFLRCEQSADWIPGAAPEVIDTQLDGGVYYVGVDTAGGIDSAMYNYGPFSFELRVKSLLPNGAACVDPVLGPQDLDCESQHCQNGYCCDSGDCCPGGEWVAPLDGTDPEAIKATPNWTSANNVCPSVYKVDPMCDETDLTDPLNPVNYCQGERWDANCVNNICRSDRVDDDVACDDSVEADRCGYFRPVYCGDFGPVAPWAQDKPDCPTFCQTDTDCDAGAHCDPAIATDPDPALGYDPLTGDPLKWCQLDLPNGAGSNENSDCIGGHSKNGFCCDSGDCCPTDDVAGALLCPLVGYTQVPECTDMGTCTGHRYDPVCSNNQCGSVFVRDDCACGKDGDLAADCGFFIPVSCDASPDLSCPATAVGVYVDPLADPLVAWESPLPACLTNCETNGADDDSKCIDIARCDLCDATLLAAGDCNADDLGVRVCMANAPNGYPCDEDSDCENKLSTNAPNGHCQNGFCCEVGTCCNLNNDCPVGDFWSPPLCTEPTRCQGWSSDAVCPALLPECEGLATWEDRAACTCAGDPNPAGCVGVLYSCGSALTENDTACDSSVLSNDCDLYLSIYCNGSYDQTPTECPTTCLVSGVEEDELCKEIAHCDPDPNLGSNSICLEDLANEEFCDENSDCASDFCQMGFCCDPGGCCTGCRPAVARLNMGTAGLKELNAGGDVEMYLSVGQPSVIEYRSALNRNGVDQGYMPSAMVRINCWDLSKDLQETDVDCGGGSCRPCENGKFCQIGTRDCESGTCTDGVCAP